MATKAELQVQLDSLKIQHENLRVGVLEGARRLKDEFDLCDEVEEVLSGLGLEFPSEMVTVTVTFDAREFVEAHNATNDDERSIREVVADRLSDGWNGTAYSVEVVSYKSESA